VHVVSLAAGGAKPVARVFWNHTENRFIVTAFDLPPAAPGRTYQLWALMGGSPAPRPLSAGVLGPDPGVSAFRVEGPVTGFAITDEPSPGAASPGSRPLVQGNTS
jgi:hypothetical protein